MTGLVYVLSGAAIFALGVLVGCGINEWAQRRRLNPLGLPTAGEMLEVIKEWKKLAENDDPFADERPTSNGEISLGDGATMRKLDDDEVPEPAAKVVITETPMDVMVNSLKEHIGHKVSIVTSAMEPDKGVMVCEDCNSTTPLPNAEVLHAAASALGVNDA